MGKMMNKAKEFAGKHEQQIDQAMEKAGQKADKATKGKHSEQIDKGVEQAQRRTEQGGR